MKKSTKGILFLLLLCNFSFAQDSAKVISDTSSFISTDSTHKPEYVFIAGPPTIGLGTGMFSYFGDIYTKHFQSPMVSRIAYELCVSQAISENFQLNFNVLFGKLGANERNAGIHGDRNLNFESQIRAGGISMQYNFGHFLPKSRTASPYISIGVESFEFLSKTDAKDANGNTYYYWSDGTIRNIDQNAPNAATAVELKRDYTYESDIREMNKDKFGKYAERSFAIPMGVGAVFKINDHINFKLGTTMHFTFTDYIDGVTFMSKGNRQGNTKYDNFMMTSCSIHYNFGTTKRVKDKIENDERYKNVDFLAIDLADYDHDGVADILDSCQGTPRGVIVDEKGCPLDDDKDNYANYKDNELTSPLKSFVDIKGVQMSDSLIEDKYNHYLDSTMRYAEVVIRVHKGTQTAMNPNQKVYSVELGSFKKGLPPDLMTQFLSIQDIASNNLPDSTTTYTAGRFKNLLDANFRKQQLISEGLTNLKVVYKQNGKYYDVPDYSSPVTNNVTAVQPTITKPAPEPIVAKPIVEPVQQPIVTKTAPEPIVAKPIVAPVQQPVEMAMQAKIEALQEKLAALQTKLDSTITKTEVKPVIAKPIIEPVQQPIVAKIDVEPVVTKPIIVPVQQPIVTKTEMAMQEKLAALQEKLAALQTKVDSAITKPAPEPVVAKMVVEPVQQPIVAKTVPEPIVAKPIVEPVQPIVTKRESEPVIAKTVVEPTVGSKSNRPITMTKQEKLEAMFSIATAQPQPIVDKTANNSESNDKIAKATAPATKVNSTGNNVTNSLNTPGVILRVQLGAYTKPLSKKVFKAVNNLIEIKTEDGLYKYMSGSFTSFDDAAKYKLEMVLNGYTGAFITAYKDGKRVSLKEAGATPIKKEDVLETSDNTQVSGVSKDLVKFRVQVGVFKNQPPDDKLAIFAKLTDVTGEKTASGLTRYVVGSFKSYKAADDYKNEIIKTYGISNPFVVALFNNEYISIPEALELLK